MKYLFLFFKYKYFSPLRLFFFGGGGGGGGGGILVEYNNYNIRLLNISFKLNCISFLATAFMKPLICVNIDDKMV